MPRPDPLPEIDQRVPFPQWNDTPTDLRMGSYLKQYDRNVSDDPDSAEPHYANARDAKMTHMLKYYERVLRHDECIHVALGAGTHPGTRDIGHPILKTFIGESRGLLLVDTNVYACQSAYHSVMNGHGLDGDRVQGVKRDLSHGMMKAYEAVLAETTAIATSEPKLLEATKRLLDEGKFMQRVYDKLAELCDEQDRQVHRIIAGEVTDFTNTNPKILTANGQPVPVNIFLADMLYSGIGAAAENQLFWQTFIQMVEEADRVTSPSDKVLDTRRDIIVNVHKMITDFGSQMAILVNKWALDSNEKALVIGVTDVATIYEDDLGGRLEDEELPRLDIPLITKNLAKYGISFKQSRKPGMQWDWRDQKGTFAHRHPIQVFTVTKNRQDSKTPEAGGPDSGVTLQQPEVA